MKFIILCEKTERINTLRWFLYCVATWMVRIFCARCLITKKLSGILYRHMVDIHDEMVSFIHQNCYVI